jgi:cytidine deaminase
MGEGAGHDARDHHLSGEICLNRIDRYFRLARQVAERGSRDRRRFRLGAVGIRTDGAVVTASNISSCQPERRAHAEVRLARKLNYGSVIYLVRILRNGSLANARPCCRCQKVLQQRGIRCYYSISETEYGVNGK